MLEREREREKREREFIDSQQVTERSVSTMPCQGTPRERERERERET